MLLKKEEDFQSGYIGIYITLLASIFENGGPAELGGYNRTQLYFIIDGPGNVW